MRRLNGSNHLLLINLLVYLLAISPLFGILYPRKYQGFHKITMDTTLEKLDKKLFCIPQGIEVIEVYGKRITLIIDEGWHRIIYSKENSDWLKAWGNYSSGNDGFKHPIGITAHGRELYVADYGNGRIVKLSYDPEEDSLVFVTAFPISGVNTVWDIDYGNDHLYVTDSRNHRIYKLTTDGTIVATYGSQGSGKDQFYCPRGIAVSGHNIYVADQGNERIVWLTDLNGQITWRGSRIITEYDQPRLYDVETGRQGCVFVTDFYNSHIYEFDGELNNLLYVFGSRGSGPNQFVHPHFINIFYDSAVGITEDWTDSTGIQVYGYKPGFTEAITLSPNCDVTERDAIFYFMLDNGAKIYMMIYKGDTLIDTVITDSLMGLGPHYVKWDGKDRYGKLVLPGNYKVRIISKSRIGNDTVDLALKVKGTLKSGTIKFNEHWTRDGSPYVIVGNSNVMSKVEIDPGVKVLFAGNYSLNVSGLLYAKGTLLDSIKFLPYIKTTEPITPGLWGSLSFLSGSDESHLEYCHIAGGGGTGQMIQVESGMVIRNCRIGNSSSYGLKLKGSSGGLIENNHFDANGLYAIMTELWAGADAEIRGNYFSNHSTYLIYIEGGLPVMGANTADGTNRMQRVSVGGKNFPPEMLDRNLKVVIIGYDK